MKIYILGSNNFMHEMVSTTDKLIEMGVDAFIAEHYRDLVSGKRQEQIRLWDNGEKAKVKIDNDYFRMHYKHILMSDAVLVINNEKHNIKNYIGGNVLMEMGQAYVNDKKIFLLNELPSGLSYCDEIIAMQPVCLQGNISKLKDY